MGIKKIILFLSCIGITATIQAKIEVPRFFSSHMVLQQKEPITIYGIAKVGETVKVNFNENHLKAVADKSGYWSVTFLPMKAGGPYNMSITGENEIKFSDVYIGEVWFCSGQSNMGWKLENSLNGEEELANANYGKIKLFSASRYMSSKPVNQVEEGNWETCTPQNAKGFSAVAYFFGRELYKKYQVPIGLINSSWGGTNIEAWMDEALLKNHPESQKILAKMKGLDMVKAVSDYKKAHVAYSIEQDETDIGVKENWQSLNTNYSTWKTFKLPSLWKNTDLEKTHGVVWVTKEIELKPEEISSVIQISLGRIDDEDVTYFNGEKIGSSTKKDLDRIYTIPKKLLKIGNNRITIKTKNLLDLGGFRGAKADLFIKTENNKISLVGNWQYKVGTPNLEEPPVRIHPRYYPTSLYNSMVNPFFGYNIKGVIWYQGESNTKNPDEYATFFPEMIKDWRAKWKKDMPFLFVQLANYANQNNREAAIREAQTAALKLDKTAMVVTLDIGEDANVHPRNKQEVGRRLAMAAQNIAYGEKNVSTSGPLVKKVRFEKEKAIITFDSEINIKGDSSKINGFLISENNSNFIKAKGKQVDSYTIEIYNTELKNPKQVKYLWEDAPGEVMIFNKSGLPAPPFKSE